MGVSVQVLDVCLVVVVKYMKSSVWIQEQGRWVSLCDCECVCLWGSVHCVYLFAVADFVSWGISGLPWHLR